MLKADPMFWWNGTKNLLENDRTPINYEIFNMTFYEKYFPTSVRNAKELEFMQLRQGWKSIVEYTAKFEELCKFSTIY